MNQLKDLTQEAEALFDYTRAIRRDLHQHPELGFQEVRTAGIIAEELRRIGLEVSTGIAKTGVVAVLDGDHPGPNLLLRVDMDALPIQEETGTEYASITPGVMHACGHDGHVSIGVTVARLLANHKHQFNGSVKFVFQPAEEGLGGAEQMIAEGVLQNPRPSMALAVHLWNERPVGWIAIVPGPLMSGAEIFRIVISGKGGHGALPQQTQDPIVAAAEIINLSQTIISRNISPLQSAVISFTRIKGGETHNVIPPVVEMEGTIRTFEPQVRQIVLDRFREIVTGVAASLGCQVELTVEMLTPAVINDPEISNHLLELARNSFPKVKLDSSYRTMVSEDMAYLLNEIPGCYIMAGSSNPALGLDAGHHHPRFDFDETVLPEAAAFLAAAVIELLSH